LQDAFILRLPAAKCDPTSFLAGVFDGHGRSGEIISSYCQVTRVIQRARSHLTVFFVQKELNEWDVGEVIVRAGVGDDCHEVIAAALKNRINMLQV
jgi:hypothetical protein